MVATNLVTHLDRMRELFDVLGSDARRCTVELRSRLAEDRTVDQFWSRTLLRTFFSWVEAQTYEMRLFIRTAHQLGALELSDGEISVMLDVSYELDKRGEPTPRPRFQPIERSMKITYRLFGQFFELNSTLPIGENGWRLFLESIQLRNRLTHPKDPSDLDVSYEEAVDMIAAINWYFTNLTALLNSCTKQVENPSIRQKF